jgi:hypothetical protein
VLAVPKNAGTGTKRTWPVSNEVNVPFPATVKVV